MRYCNRSVHLHSDKCLTSFSENKVSCLMIATVAIAAALETVCNSLTLFPLFLRRNLKRIFLHFLIWLDTVGTFQVVTDLLIEACLAKIAFSGVFQSLKLFTSLHHDSYTFISLLFNQVESGLWFDLGKMTRSTCTGNAGRDTVISSTQLEPVLVGSFNVFENYPW